MRGPCGEMKLNAMVIYVVEPIVGLDDDFEGVVKKNLN